MVSIWLLANITLTVSVTITAINICKLFTTIMPTDTYIINIWIINLKSVDSRHGWSQLQQGIKYLLCIWYTLCSGVHSYHPVCWFYMAGKKMYRWRNWRALLLSMHQWSHGDCLLWINRTVFKMPTSCFGNDRVTDKQLLSQHP